MTVLYVALIVFVVIVILYLLAIMPRLSRQGERNKFTGVYYAHRGVHDNEGEAPENSMAAFRKAVKYGYGIELDTQLTKDMVPVVFHDFTLERMCNKPGKICDYTYEELQSFTLGMSREQIPRLQEVLKMVNGRVPLIIEYKVEWMDISICSVVDKLLRGYKGIYCIESFNPMVLLWYRRYHNDVFRGQLADAFIRTKAYKGGLYWALQHLLFNCVTKPDFIAYNHKHAGMLSRNICRKLYRNLAVAWTIQSQEELLEAKDKYDLFIFDSFRPKKM